MGGIMHHSFKTSGTCSTQIDFDKDENGVVTNIKFTGGCDGNLKAISKILDGWKASDIVAKVGGNQCRSKGTSCADQLARAVMEN